MKDYTKTYKDNKLRFEQLTISDHDKKTTGCLTKYKVTSAGAVNGQPLFFGTILQKYTGKCIPHPSGIPNTTHREREWLYDWTIDAVKVSGSCPAMNKCIDVLLDLLSRDNVHI